MKKAFDQTVRDLKREVNKKVLKVPSIEQKILDATSNEPWGPHGSLLADIAQATRNYHEYQIIMNVIWKRINDTGKNWRHVYKALTVLEYLVAHGSERVIDDIKEHAYQISTLSDFQYIDSSGRDQGNNVRRKSQSLVALVNDKERIQEARQKAAANRDKYRSTISTGRPGSYGDRYDDDRYASRDEDRYGNGKEREWGYRDDDKYGRGRDSFGGEGDRYGRYADERYGRDSYRDDDYRRGHGNDDYQYSSRNRSLSRDRSLDDDDRSSRSGGGRADNLPHDERQLDRRLSEQSIGAPPSYEEVAKDAQNHVQEDRNETNFTAAAPKASSPSAPRASSSSEGMNQTSSPFAPAANTPFTNQGSGHAPAGVSASTNNNDNGFDEFDPRGMASAAPPAVGSHEMDLFGSVSASDPIYSLALVPLTTNSGSEADLPANSSFGTDFVATSSASAVFSQAGENPFGDPPFKATQENFPNQQENFPPVSSFNSISSGGAEILAPAAPKIETTTSFGFDGSFGGVTYNPLSDGQQSSFYSPAILTSEAPATQPNNISGMLATASATPQESWVATNPQSGPPAIFASQATQFTAQEARPIAPTNPQTTQLNFLSQSGLQSPPMEVTASTSSLTPVKAVPSNDKFETKSTVWADTLSRGLVNLNISGSKINPHADIGIDFDSINRKEKRKEEKKVSAAPISTTTMGKAMGSGSGIGRAGANTLTRPLNPTMGMGMGMGMMGGGGMGMGMMGNGGMGMGGYGGSINQPMGMGMPPRPPMGAPMGGSGMPGVGYNPMMGMGNYGSQQPYGGGYR